MLTACACVQEVFGQLPQRSLRKRHIEPNLCLMAVGQKGLQAVYSRQAYCCECVPEEGPEARYELLQGSCRYAVAAAEDDGQEMKHAPCKQCAHQLHRYYLLVAYRLGEQLR